MQKLWLVEKIRNTIWTIPQSNRLVSNRSWHLTNRDEDSPALSYVGPSIGLNCTYIQIYHFRYINACAIYRKHSWKHRKEKMVDVFNK